MFITIPIINIFTTIELPPKLTNDKGTPIIGKIPITIPTFIRK
jgi:hypothetical protein